MILKKLILNKNILYKLQFFLWNARLLSVNNIFDYNYAVRKRWYNIGEISEGNSLYSFGTIFRRYSGYKGAVFLVNEHSPLLIGDDDNYGDLVNHDRKIVCVSSAFRQYNVQKYADKLYIPIGPGIMPYAKSIYDDVQINAIKENLGKTLLVFESHSGKDMLWSDVGDCLLEQVESIAREHGFNTILTCIYYEDILRGKHLRYERRGWVVVSAGNKSNPDFADCLKTIFLLSDHVIINGYGSQLVYAGYFKKPITYIYNKHTLEDHNYKPEVFRNWYEEKQQFAKKLLGDYSDELTSEQYEILDKYFGYSEVLTPEQAKQLLLFSQELEKYRSIDDNKVKIIIKKNKYSLIKPVIEKALQVRTEKLSLSKKGVNI